MKAKQIFKSTHYTIINLVTYFFILGWALTACAAMSEKDLEGYEPKFGAYPKEREILYEYYKRMAPDEMSIPDKDRIAIDLYDIDDDGIKEIICYVSEIGYCGSAGCSFNIFKQSHELDKQGNPIYIPLRWNDPNDKTSTDGLTTQSVKILKNKTNGVHDLLFNGSIIWQWQGTYYDKFKNVNE